MCTRTKKSPKRDKVIPMDAWLATQKKGVKPGTFLLVMDLRRAKFRPGPYGGVTFSPESPDAA